MQEITSLNTDCRQRLRSRGICVIVPTFNNAGTILDVVTRTHAMCHDVIVVNDGCTDSTPQILSAVEGITVVTLPRNSGKGCALKAGFRKAIEMGFAYAITLDADGQHFPEDIPLLLEANIKHPDALIVGERKDLEKQSRLLDQSQILIETPYRNDALFADMLAGLAGDTRLCVAADITLPTQYIRTDTVAGWRRKPAEIGKRPCVFILLAARPR